MSDAEWLVDMAAHNMVGPSVVPAPEVRELRELTRYSKTQIDVRRRDRRLEKVLQDAGIKLTSVAFTVLTQRNQECLDSAAGDWSCVVEIRKEVKHEGLSELWLQL